jgi:uncharacterized protein (DUF1501 family)
LTREELTMTFQSAKSRRQFLQGLGRSFAAGSAAALVPQLGFIPAAAAQTAGPYRALVCIYLAGANDSYNWLVPRDSELTGSRYDVYRASRGGVYSAGNTAGLALGYNDLLPIQPSNTGDGYGLHPSSTDFSVTSGNTTQNHLGLKSIFDSGKAAFLANVGTLLAPISKTQYNGGAARPAQLFSHNDQELQWQVGMGDTSNLIAKHGWGGRVAKATAGGNLPNGLSPTLSIAGSARFLIGDGVLPYQLSTTGVDRIDNYIPGSGNNNFPVARRNLLNDLLNDSYTSPFQREYAATMSRALGVGEELFGLLNAPTTGDITTLFPANNTLAAQLRMVARMIKISRATLNATRQVYYVRFGSFDLHSGMFDPNQPVATGGHGALLTVLNQAIGAFWSALDEIGARDEVTTFTMSDFARTLSGNGNGSDHAWGGNALVVGGRVDGGKVYGRYPQLRLDANNDAEQDWSFSRGQYIPTTAVDQYCATMARWMGVTDTAALGAMFPNLANFGSSNLGFMLS